MRKEIIRIENVSKRYGQKVVLDDVSLTINKGETVTKIRAPWETYGTSIKFVSLVCRFISRSEERRVGKEC